MSDFAPISFDLTVELTMPYLSKVMNYKREHIISLFETLEKAGHGTYIRGSRGAGNCARFTPNENCPKNYTILVDSTTLPKRRKKLQEQQNVVCKPKIIVNDVEINSSKKENDTVVTSTSTSITDNLWALSKNITLDPSSGFIGYECQVYANAFLILNRVRGGGKKTIEDALGDVWDSVNSRMGLKDKPKTKRISWIASSLRGNGFYILDRAE